MGKLVKFSPPRTTPKSLSVKMLAFLPSCISYFGNGKFEFLNQVHVFDKIDWNFNENGKLWTYNLNYFEFLNQPDFSKEEGLRLINDFISQSLTHLDAYEPYPISLRIISWVKFLSLHKIHDELIDKQLCKDCIRLTKNLEYHLLANHLLENGFGLLFGAYHFQDEKLYRIAEEIIRKELNEQILSDGAHYELSPMYHQIILSRVLDSYNLVRSNDWKQDKLQPILLETAQKMLSWLENVTFQSGEIPMVNDATRGIAPTTKELVEYARRLNVLSEKIPLGESGYRMYKDNVFELLCDVGQISPAYQPGHSHADSLNFVVHVDGVPCVVDTGISTYEKNERRQWERSTEAHNTLVVNNENSSQVWGGFRVGRRANTTILHEEAMGVTAQHDGYRRRGIIHRRSFALSDTHLMITDRVEGKYTENDIRGYLHLHPDISCVSLGNKWIINEKYLLEFTPDTAVNLENYLFADGFNQLRDAKRIVYQVKDKTISISLRLYD